MIRAVRAEPLVIGAVAALGIGMALVAGGVRVGPLFVPGVIVLGIGLLAAAAAGAIAALPARDGESA